MKYLHVEFASADMSDYPCGWLSMAGALFDGFGRPDRQGRQVQNWALIPSRIDTVWGRSPTPFKINEPTYTRVYKKYIL